MNLDLIQSTIENFASAAVVKAELWALPLLNNPATSILLDKPEAAAKWLTEQIEALDDSIPLADTPWADQLERMGVEKVVQAAFDKASAGINALSSAIKADLERRGATSTDSSVGAPTVTDGPPQ